MKIKVLPYLFSRIFALYLLAETVFFIAKTFPFILASQSFSFSMSVTIAAITIFILLGAWFFWFKADWMAGKITGNYIDQEIKAPLSLEDIQTTSFMLIGIWLLGEVIPSILHDITPLIFDIPKAYNYNPWPNLIADITQFIIGAGLVLGSHGVMRAVDKLRGK